MVFSPPVLINDMIFQHRHRKLKRHRLNTFVTTANLHGLHKEHFSLKKVTTRYQQQIFQPTRKEILLLCLILNM